MIENVLIRRAVVDDADELARLHVRTWQWAYRGQIPDAYLDGLSETIGRRVTWWRQMLAVENTPFWTWVAMGGDAVLAFACVGPSQDDDAEGGTGELSSIYVDPSVTRRGIGNALLFHAVKDLREKGYGPITLWVIDTNSRARGFYEALGWMPDGAAKDDERPGFVLREVRYRIEVEG